MPKLLTPNVNFLPTSPKQLASSELSVMRWDMEALNTVAGKAGYDGIQLHDGRFFAHIRELLRATPERARQLGRLIVSYHEGWQGVSNPNPKPGYEGGGDTSKGSLLFRGASKVLFAPGADTLDHLEAIESKIGRPERQPYIMFPDPDGRLSHDRSKVERFPHSRIQPTADVAAAWGSNNAASFALRTKRRGYAVAWDTFHGDRRGKVTDRVMSWGSMLPTLVNEGLVDEVHVSVARYDMAQTDPKRTEVSEYEARALAGVEGYSLAKTPLGETFDFLRAEEWQGDVTIEAPFTGLATAIGAPLLSREDVIDVHSTMVQHVREQLPHIQWQ